MGSGLASSTAKLMMNSVTDLINKYRIEYKSLSPGRRRIRRPDRPRSGKVRKAKSVMSLDYDTISNV